MILFTYIQKEVTLTNLYLPMKSGECDCILHKERALNWKGKYWKCASNARPRRGAPETFGHVCRLSRLYRVNMPTSHDFIRFYYLNIIIYREKIVGMSTLIFKTRYTKPI